MGCFRKDIESPRRDSVKVLMSTSESFKNNETDISSILMLSLTRCIILVRLPNFFIPISFLLTRGNLDLGKGEIRY